MSNRAKSVSTATAGQSDSVAAVLLATDIEKRLTEARSRLAECAGRTEAIRQECELHKISDSNITAELLAEFKRREIASMEEGMGVEELIDALLGQLQAQRDREWLSAKSKRKAELADRCMAADGLYEELDAVLTKAGQLAGELKSLHIEVESFNRTTDVRVGYVEAPEYRIRHAKGSYTRPRPLWDELGQMMAVYPGDEDAAILCSRQLLRGVSYGIVQGDADIVDFWFIEGNDPEKSRVGLRVAQLAEWEDRTIVQFNLVSKQRVE